AKPADRVEHLDEGLRRQVLGVVPIADTQVEVAVDAIEVKEVQLFERVAVPTLGTLDKRAHCCASHSASAEADSAFAGEALDVDDPRKRDRVSAVLRIELE